MGHRQRPFIMLYIHGTEFLSQRACTAERGKQCKTQCSVQQATAVTLKVLYNYSVINKHGHIDQSVLHSSNLH